VKNFQLQVVPLAEHPHKPLVGVRLFPPQAMVHMGGDQPQPIPGGMAEQKMRQRDGIRAPGKADHNAASFRKHFPPGNRPFDFPLDFSGLLTHCG
jgi:hypothetical protein